MIKASIIKISLAFLQIVIVLIGIGTLVLLLWEPHLEGRNVQATLFEIYFKDPFLAYFYIASVPFFAALYQASKILGYVGKNTIFSQEAVKAVRAIKFYAVMIIGFAILGEIFIMLNDSDDRAGGVFMGTLIIFGSLIIVSATAVFEKILQEAIAAKPENN